MSPRTLSPLFFALLACAPAASASARDSAAQSASATRGDFSWSGTVKKGGEVRLANVSGDVEVVQGRGDAVRVEATISGRDADSATVLVEEGAGEVKIRTKLARKRKRNADVRVDYRIEIPAGVDFEADVVSGNIDAKGISGALDLEAVSGNIEASGSGDVRVATVSGDASVSLPKGTRRAMLEAVSGRLEISVPPSLGLDLAATSLSGGIDADVKHERTQQLVGSAVRISRGDRGATVRMETVSGRIRIRKG
ncbi:MAG: DUF4097 family beta strand repeat-containing protein [Nannocystaceae bacterium]|nr:DUF4097 family beta strand repeat-containing protein [bacterium]